MRSHLSLERANYHKGGGGGGGGACLAACRVIVRLRIQYVRVLLPVLLSAEREPGEAKLKKEEEEEGPPVEKLGRPRKRELCWKREG